ncbi:MAG: hypothetical protein A2511_01580 [Deltaproteobacteria bacterium RIFOXYD12_FULL_50_9]|nr:MAG: hypothetical protein A2511_01580 [Deltaproteobacteria bacterium RIFOXYD12_FULL_50_9]
MNKLRNGLIGLGMLICSVTSAAAEVSVGIGIGLPNVSIGINLPLFPELVAVPGYPVYYAPQVDANYFFHDGMYWVYRDDNWYASSWYNGPWGLVGPDVVPLFILRIPVRYYRQPPLYFHGWRSNYPPRWGQHWGHEWEHRRSGWDRWNHRRAPSRAPLPVYQREYSGDRYPHVDQQLRLRGQNYRYQPRDKIVQQHFKQVEEQRAPAPALKNQKQQDKIPSTPRRQRNPIDSSSKPALRGDTKVQQLTPDNKPVQQREPAVQDQKQQPKNAQRDLKQQEKAAQREQKQQEKAALREQKQQTKAVQRQQKEPRIVEQQQRSPARGESRQPRQDRGQEQNRDERGGGRNN